MPPDGFLNVLKPPGMTSHDVVAFCRPRLGRRKVGHLGTLDPAAAGVLPLAIGEATRLFDYAGGDTKSYRAEITFGLATDTMDAEGSVIAEGDSSALDRATLAELLTGFVGEIEQVPPAYAALQVGGKRLYALARKDAAPAISPRKVRISALELVKFWPGTRPRALVDIVCSGGTYVRSVASDVGRAAGYGAYLSFLVRTRVGRFEIADALTLEEIEAAKERGELQGAILPPDWPLLHLAAMTLDQTEARRFMQGTAVATEAPAAWPARVYGPGGFVGLGEVRDGSLRPRVVIEPREGREP